MNNKHRFIAVAGVVCMAIAGLSPAHDRDNDRDDRNYHRSHHWDWDWGWHRDRNRDPEKGIVDLTTNYGASGVIASVAGVSGATDSIVVTFAEPMHPGNFGMGVNFAKAWTKTWNADNTVLTIGGDIDFSDAAEPALIVYLMQTEADRKDISEPNIFKFQDIKVKEIKAEHDQVNLNFDILSANGKGYTVYVAKSQATRFKRYDQVNFHSKGVHIKGLDDGQTYWIYVEYKSKGLVATRTTPLAITVPKHSGNGNHGNGHYAENGRG